MSTRFYDINAEAFFARTIGVDMAETQKAFLAHLPPGGRILEAGCGVGRDSRAFKDLGFDVTAFDGSARMVEMARTVTGLPVQMMDFRDIPWRREFDGVWANACLLHVPLADLPAVVGRLGQALVPGGVFYMSFKYGRSERITDDGLRHFTDLDEAGGRDLVEAAGDLTWLDAFITPDGRPDRPDERWLNLLCRRADVSKTSDSDQI